MIRLLLAASILALAACGSASTTVLLVRHAEKGAGRDPDLTGEGQRRALALVQHARDANVAAAFHTQFKRTAQTVRPAAEHLGIPLVQVEYTPGKEDEHADAVIANMRKHFPGRTVLVAGHTTTVPVIMRKLGVTTAREIPETEYGTLFVVIDGIAGEERFGP